jgi:lipopolysaccharide export system protein LptA
MDDDGSGRGVQARAEVPGPAPLIIASHRSTWSLRDGTMVFEGEVVATRGDVELACDRLEVQYRDDRVDRAVATGEVRVLRGKQEARGSRALLTTTDGRVTLEGDPVLRDGARHLRGERIVLFLDDERVECEQCRVEISADAVLPEEGP